MWNLSYSVIQRDKLMLRLESWGSRRVRRLRQMTVSDLFRISSIGLFSLGANFRLVFLFLCARNFPLSLSLEGRSFGAIGRLARKTYPVPLGANRAGIAPRAGVSGVPG